jgi:DNA-directed RNA polymerase sigma subunit (sigma70/sigma32)
MARHEAEKTLSQDERMAVFLALVEAQDREMTVAQSRQAIARQFGLSEEQVRQIEREGLDGNWPPLA